LQDAPNSVYTRGKVVEFTKPRRYPFSVLSQDLIIQIKRETTEYKAALKYAQIDREV